MKLNTGLDNKRIIINILFNLLVFITNAFISLILTPKITSHFGAEAYGFVKLATDFAGYASLFSLALNSMSSRFIMIELEKGNSNEASKYYSSVTFANYILALSLLVPSILLIVFINRLLAIPNNLLAEVRLTFIWTFANFLICLACTTYGNCFFLKNRLDISSLLTSITSVIKAVFILGFFYFFNPKISVIAFGSIIVSAIFIPCNIYFHNKLTPELKFNISMIEICKIKEVIISGVWNSITRLSNILTTGLDLLITNVFIGAKDMGYLSIAKTIPNFIYTMINTVGCSFSPNILQIYAKGNLLELQKAIKSSMRIMSVFATVPNAILIVIGIQFYSLWVPEQPAHLLNILSIITAANSCILGPMQPLYQVFTITNKIKQSSIAFIIQGIISIVITYVLLVTTDLGVFAVAGVSVILSIITVFIYHLPMGAIYLGLHWHTFFPELLRVILSLSFQLIIIFGIVLILPVSNSWIQWFINAFISGVIGLIINFMVILNKQERIMIISTLTTKIRNNVNK